MEVKEEKREVIYMVIVDGKLYEAYRHNTAWEVVEVVHRPVEEGENLYRPVEDENLRREVLESVVSNIAKND